MITLGSCHLIINRNRTVILGMLVTAIDASVLSWKSTCTPFFKWIPSQMLKFLTFIRMLGNIHDKLWDQKYWKFSFSEF